MQKVTEKHKLDDDTRTITKLLDIPWSTIKFIIRKWREYGTCQQQAILKNGCARRGRVARPPRLLWRTFKLPRLNWLFIHLFHRGQCKILKVKKKCNPVWKITAAKFNHLVWRLKLDDCRKSRLWSHQSVCLVVHMLFGLIMSQTLVEASHTHLCFFMLYVSTFVMTQ